MSRRWVRAIAGALTLLGSSVAGAGDWPQWGGQPGRNMVSSETNLPESFVPGEKDAKSGAIKLSTTKNVKWSVKLGSYCYGNPTVANGRVFLGTDDYAVADDPRFERTKGGLVRCLEEATGKTLWQLVVPVRTGLPSRLLYSHQYLGTCSSPTVDGDRVYVVTQAAEVLCLDVQGQANGNDGPYQDEAKYMAGAGKKPIQLGSSDADIIWRYDLINDLGVAPHDVASCSVLVHGDALYLSTSNGVDKPHTTVLEPEKPAFIALDKRTGKLAAFENEKISARMFHTQWSSPSLGQVGGKTLVFVGGSDGFCYAFEALASIPEKAVPLKLVWSYDCNPPHYRLPNGKPIAYLSGDKRKKGSPNKNDGTYVGPSDIIATPTFCNNRVYVALGQDPAHGRGRGMIHCIDATKTGDITQSGKVWSYDGLDRTIATATIADGLVYISDIAGRLHCLDADSGQACWVHDSKAEMWGSPLVADGKVYVGNANSLLVLAHGKQAKLLSSIRLGSQVFSSQIVANGVLYVASQRYLWAVQKQ